MAQEQVEHAARGLLHGIHDVFSPSNNDATDSVSMKKLRKGDGKFEKKASSDLTLKAMKKLFG
jgi:hypothetical protein